MVIVLRTSVPTKPPNLNERITWCDDYNPAQPSPAQQQNTTNTIISGQDSSTKDRCGEEGCVMDPAPSHETIWERKDGTETQWLMKVMKRYLFTLFSNFLAPLHDLRRKKKRTKTAEHDWLTEVMSQKIQSSCRCGDDVYNMLVFLTIMFVLMWYVCIHVYKMSVDFESDILFR